MFIQLYEVFVKKTNSEPPKGAAGTAIEITLFTAEQTNLLAEVPSSTGPEVLAAGVKYTFSFITGISVVGFISSLFVRNK